MAVGMIQKAILYMKEVQEAGLFAVMADSRLFQAFAASPAYYIVLPLMGLSLSVLALIKGFELAKASNKNLDKWMDFSTSSICAVLASISLYGAVISHFLGVTFAAGPWFFLSSLLVGFIHQSVVLGLNLYRAYDSPEGSGQRKHFIQAAINNILILGLLTAAIGAVLFVMLFPIAPIVGTVFAVSASVLIAATIIWQLTPYRWKLVIKEFLHLGKPQIEEQPCPEESLNLEGPLDKPNVGLENDGKYQRLFTRPDYSAEIKAMNIKSGEAYLQKTIAAKIASLRDPSVPQSQKTQDKLRILFKLATALTKHTDISKGLWLEFYPLAFQSFWAQKGDVEQLFDAALVLQDKFRLAKVTQSDETESLGLQIN